MSSDSTPPNSKEQGAFSQRNLQKMGVNSSQGPSSNNNIPNPTVSQIHQSTAGKRPPLTSKHSGSQKGSFGTLINNGSSLHSGQFRRPSLLGSGASTSPVLEANANTSNQSVLKAGTCNIANGKHAGPVSNATGSLGRSRSRSLTQTLGHNLHNNAQYLAQEKAYLRKIRNQIGDDYYTKGIPGAADDLREGDSGNYDDDDYEEDETNLDNDFLAEIDNDKYQIDYNLALSLLKAGRNKININPNKIALQLSRDAEDPAVVERLEWQSMLTSVLTGDVVKSEKTKIINNSSSENGQESLLHAAYKENLWFGIRAKLFNRSEEDQRRIIAYRRTLADSFLESILTYEISYDDPANNPPRRQIVSVLEQYDNCCELWRTLEDMRTDKPICRSPDFQDRIDALNAWLSITDAIKRETTSLRLWIGNDELDITKSSVEGTSSPSASILSSKVVKKIFDEDNKSLAERLMKEKDINSIFQKRVFQPLAPWMNKSKDTYVRLGHIFETLKLPDYIHDLIQLCLIPMKLIKEIIKVRLLYARKLQNPTLMMIDQMIDDFKSYISIALDVKLGVVEYCKPNTDKTWLISDLFDGEYSDFDNVVLESVLFFFVLLNRKLLDSSRSATNFRTFKEPDELEETLYFLKRLGVLIEGANTLVAENITLLSLKLTHRLFAFFNNQIRSPPEQASKPVDLIRWYSSTAEDFGQLRRKLARFTSSISRDFANSLVFEIPHVPNATKAFLDVLKSFDYFLVYTDTIESQGTYFFASPELLGKDQEILKLINGSYVGLDPNDQNAYNSELFKIDSTYKALDASELDDEVTSELDIDTSLVLAICPPKPIFWEGTVVRLEIQEVPIEDVQVGQIMVVSKLPYYDLHIVRDRFMNMTRDVIMSSGYLKSIEQRCSLSRVNQDLRKIHKLFFKMSLAALDSVKIVTAKCKALAPEGGCLELINNYFIFARDYGKNTLKTLDSSKKSSVIMKLMQLSIDWVSFICDDCIPTDRKTFRWCVLALEFAMDMTRGFNILILNDEQFYRLKLKVARCMSLLISHFDIMGARSSEAEKKKLLKLSSQRHRIANTDDDEYILKAYKEDIMKEIEAIEENRRDLQENLHSIGRVIDVTDLEYQFVTLLASSFSSVSIRWQKGKFIGGGSFGHVYAAVNLDTGGVMAVKEIRFYDSQSIKNIVAAIKDEMTILEMLNHPNVVQYYGVEVHREKVYIFMEFCEGGSLASLLTHGRIEDEMVIQVYTLQMLEGLAYLHQSGVAHRDIKPENILLDHNGVIKFVDFGAAKVIANSGRTRGPSTGSDSHGVQRGNLNTMTGTPMYMSPEVITGSSTDKNGVVDIWSLGCCVLEMATGRRPWANLDNEWAIMYHIAAGHKPQLPTADQLSEGGRKFISRCLEHDPKKRPSAVDLLNDPWIVAIRQAAFGSENSTPSSELGSDL